MKSYPLRDRNLTILEERSPLTECHLEVEKGALLLNSSPVQHVSPRSQRVGSVPGPVMKKFMTDQINVRTLLPGWLADVFCRHPAYLPAALRTTKNGQWITLSFWGTICQHNELGDGIRFLICDRATGACSVQFRPFSANWGALDRALAVAYL